MLLPDAIEGLGYFWIPSDANTKLPGVLRISRTGSCELNLTKLSSTIPLQSDDLVFGDPLRYSGRPYHKRIIGVVKWGTFSNLVTLHDCFYNSWNYPSGVGICSSSIVANTALVGAGFEDDDELSFSEFRFSFPGLDEWLQITGIDIEDTVSEETGHFLGMTIKYAPPANKAYQLKNGMTLEFNFDSNIPFLGGYTETTITQKAHVSIRSDKLLPLSEFLSVAWKLKNFLSFCTDAALAFDSVVGYSPHLLQEIDENKTRRIPVKIYYDSAPRIEEEVKVQRHDILLSFPQIGDDFEDMINRWLTMYEDCQPILDSYFYTIHSSSRSSIEREFLVLAQAIESFHRRRYDRSIIPKDEYCQIVSRILDVIPTERKSIFEGRLRFGNEPSFGNRLKEMFSPFAHLYKLKGSGKQYIRQVVDTRNFLTHYDKSLESKAASGLDLVFLRESLEAMLQLHFLRTIGVGETAINIMAKDSRSLKYKLVVFDNE